MMPNDFNEELEKENSTRRNEKIIRYTMIIGFCVLLLASLSFLGIRCYRYFYIENQHFLFRELKLEPTFFFNVKNSQYILEQMKHGCVVNKTNLLTIDLREIRKTFLKYPVVKNVEVRRILPGTLELKITERTPLAYLSNSQKVTSLIDENGVVFPFTSPNNISFSLPYITHIKKPESFPMGKKVEDSDVLSAIALIQLIQQKPILTGAGYSPAVIQINSQRDRFECILTPMAGNQVFSKNPTVWIPMNAQRAAEALQRFDTILLQKINDKETLSFADITLEYNINTLP